MRLGLRRLPQVKYIIVGICAVALCTNLTSVYWLISGRRRTDSRTEWNVLSRERFSLKWFALDEVLPKIVRGQLGTTRLARCQTPYRYTLCIIDIKGLPNNDTVYINNKPVFTVAETQPTRVVILTLTGCDVKEVKTFRTNRAQKLRQYVAGLRRGAYFLGLMYHPADNNTDLRGVLSLPGAKHYAPKTSSSPAKSAFLGRVGYWKQMAYKSVTRNNAALGLRKIIYYGTNFHIVKEAQPFAQVTALHSDLSPAGFWSPKHCQSTHTLAVIIPFRDRYSHLAVFVENMIRFLKAQLLSFTMFVVEQADRGWFNRATLMNIGYLEAQKHRYFNCFAFHDVDLIPEDLTNLYYCGRHPRHLAVTRSKDNYTVYPGYEYFGGAILMTPGQIEEINGFPNTFYGWGAEDDEMLQRIKIVHQSVDRYPMEIASYTCLHHNKDRGNPYSGRHYRFAIDHAKKEFHKDGLNTVNYRVLKTVKTHLYTHILVEIPTYRETHKEEHNQLVKRKRNVNEPFGIWNVAAIT